MAYIDGKWLERDEREKEIAITNETLDGYAKLAELDSLTDRDIEVVDRLLKRKEKLERVHRAERDFLYFMYEYFSEEMNPGNPANLIPEGQTLETAADFHKELCGLLNEVTKGESNSKIAWSVGRGHAKTAYLSNGYLCHQVIFRLKRYIVLVSETVDVAGDFIQWTSYQLKYNEKLREDFGEIMSTRKNMNEADNRHEFVTSSGTKVEAKGVQAQMRGLRHLSERPDLFILDDLESAENTNTPELRKKNRDWFTTEMLPALGKGGLCVYMGTIVHYDSLLNYTIKERKDFKSRIFPAIIEWSERDDLWEKWQEIRRRDEEDSAEKARQFYEANKSEMLKGTRVLWESRYTYYDLMEIREDNGTKAFNQEYLGNAIDEESQIFKPEEFYYFTEEDLPQTLEYYAGVDFAMGKEKGDYSAIVIVGRSPNDILYVVDTYVERVHPDVLLEKVADKAIEWQLEGIAIEAQQAQEWFADKVAQALIARGYPAHTRLKPIKQRNRKALRIESLLPDIQNGRIRFKRNGQRLMLEMFELYPNHNHDDAPDALHMATTVAKGGNVTVRRSRKRTR